MEDGAARVPSMNKSLSSVWGSVRGMLPTIYSASPQSGVSFIVFDSTSFMLAVLTVV